MYYLKCIDCDRDLTTKAIKESFKFLAEHDHDDNIKHGTRTGYGIYHCRCKECTRVNSLAVGENNKAAKNKPVPEGGHGYSAYKRYGCRCDICKSANSERRKIARAKNNG